MSATDSLILCATTRLAQTLRQAPRDAAQVWLTPQALTLAQWLSGVAEEVQLSGLADLPQLLDPFAEKLLWEQVIAETLDDAQAPLFDLAGMAASAAEAHALVEGWSIDPMQAPMLPEETRRFLQWQSLFRQRCRRSGWVDPVTWQQALIDVLAAGLVRLPEEVRWVGFDRHTPLEKRLMAVLAGRGVKVEKGLPLAVDRPKGAVLPCADRDAECAAVVAWVQGQVQRNPQVRLGIVAPDLQSLRDQLEFLLDDVLHPAFLRPDAAGLARCYNFSLGRRLADLPLIQIALDWLSLAAARGKVEQSRIGRLLLGIGWSAASAEADARAQLEAAMRRELAYFTRLPAVLRLGERLAARAQALCPDTLAALSAFVAAQDAIPARRQLPGHWLKTFETLLDAVQWPGDRRLSSHEYQARRAFLAELSAFGRLDGVLGPLTFAEAVRRFTQLCRQRIFQPETRGQPGIQVLGVLESAGLEFDAMWVMGMNDDVWPPAPRPNPLLPAELLRAAGAPHASAEIEVEFASRVHARWLAAAPEIIFSCSLMAGNRVLRPSPLIAGLPHLDSPPAPLARPALAMMAAAEQEWLDDALAPPVAEGEKLSGGSSLLRAQAICPAWGFYQFRLGAEAMELPVEGLDPAARGTLVHGALEAFWRMTGDSVGLDSLLAEGLPTAIEQAVTTALDQFEQVRHLTLPARFRQLEARRLRRLLEEWLRLEAEREQPFTVLACEQAVEISIEQIRVNMVVDRIDQLADGRRLIIDYKTGAAIDFHNWAEDRLTEPQLPIYAALVADGPVAGVAFAKVLLEKAGFAGVAEMKDLLPGLQGIGDEKQKIFRPERFPDWPALIAHWRHALQQIALEVRAGVAGVTLNDEAALKYCEVKPLLRLAERARQAERARAGGAA